VPLISGNIQITGCGLKSEKTYLSLIYILIQKILKNNKKGARKWYIRADLYHIYLRYSVKSNQCLAKAYDNIGNNYNILLI
jgi:hypothetical protein